MSLPMITIEHELAPADIAAIADNLVDTHGAPDCIPSHDVLDYALEALDLDYDDRDDVRVRPLLAAIARELDA